jgi:hypothetical protein
MGDRAYTTLLAWPYPGRERLPRRALDELARHDALPDSDTPISLPYLGSNGAAVLPGDRDSGPILAIVDEDADYGIAAYGELIAALTAAELHVYAGNEAGGDYGAVWEHHPRASLRLPVERRRCDRGELVVASSDLLESGERTLAEIPSEVLAIRATRLLTPPDGVPEAVMVAAY